MGTYFTPSNIPVKSHKRWIAIQDHTHGTIAINSAATDALTNHGKSLLLKGVTECNGDFESGDVVQIFSHKGVAIAQGIVNFDIEYVKGAGTETTDGVLVHRDHLVLL